MYEWSKTNERRDGLPMYLNYNGLTFPLYRGKLTSEELKSGNIFFAFYGKRYMSERAIKYHVDLMIERGEYLPEAA